jgi:hypothetical protein
VQFEFFTTQHPTDKILKQKLHRTTSHKSICSTTSELGHVINTYPKSLIIQINFLFRYFPRVLNIQITIFWHFKDFLHMYIKFKLISRNWISISIIIQDTKRDIVLYTSNTIISAILMNRLFHDPIRSY